MALTDSIPEPLQRKVGPFPIWVWVVGVGGGLLLYVFVSRSGGIGSGGGDSEPAEPDEFDFESAAAGPAAPAGQDTSNDFSEPMEFDFGTFSDGFDTADAASSGEDMGQSIGGPIELVHSGTIIQRIVRGRKKVAKPKQKRRQRRRNETPRKRNPITKRQQRRRQTPRTRRKSFAIDEPHIDYAVAPNGAPPTVTTFNVPAIGIGAPDRMSRRQIEPLNSTRAADAEPFIASKTPPAPIFRAWGRPFHGANRRTQSG